ncbi:MAG: GTP-binding protein [Chloroflexus aggregans]|uniref:GTP-binding protein n=1 Tax=Chloroflexus aggregans TaxID=152260 RepID=A0A2J6WSK7_9CHLR|nr:MAG: GTP-binding protein [Chloroflexus aggregans]
MASAVNRLVAKICLIGEFSVGKTSLVRRFVEGIFDERYLSTLGVQISRHTMHVDQTEFSLLIWDTAGGEELNQIVQNYYRGAAGALLVCDVTRPETLPALNAYATAFHQASPATPLVIAANKADLVNQRRLSDDEISSVAAVLSADWLCTSARTGEGVQEAFHILGRRIKRQRERI